MTCECVATRCARVVLRDAVDYDELVRETGTAGRFWTAHDGEEQASFEWSAGGVAIPAEETVYMKERISFPDSAVFSNDLFYLVGIQVHVDSSALKHALTHRRVVMRPAFAQGGVVMGQPAMGQPVGATVQVTCLHGHAALHRTTTIHT